MALSQQREERAALVAELEQLTGARVAVRAVNERDTAILLQGGSSKLIALRMKTVPNGALRTALELVESWR